MLEVELRFKKLQVVKKPALLSTILTIQTMFLLFLFSKKKFFCFTAAICALVKLDNEFFLQKTHTTKMDGVFFSMPADFHGEFLVR